MGNPFQNCFSFNENYFSSHNHEIVQSFDLLIDITRDNKMTNKKWAVKRITVNLAAQEAEKLDKYCQQTGRPATDIIRELIRSLPVPDDTV
jgi:hypothetical protein